MWANIQKQRGFTIVELLIVIVVIAILAAITIVAYNGIQTRAKASQASSALAQAKKKLEVYKVDVGSGSYPTTGNLALAGVTDGSTTYQYTSDGTTFCLTGTASNVSYKITNTGAPTAGGCSGHGQGGVAAITNMAPNPSLEANSTSWGPNWGTSGAGTNARQTDGGQYGSGYYRMSWTANATVSWGGAYLTNLAVTAGRTYSASAWVRVSRPHNMFIFMRPNTWSTNPDMTGTVVSVPANTWTRLVWTGTIQSGVTSMGPKIERTGSGNWQAGDVLDVDGLIISEASTPPNYADGESTDWTWNGTQHNSTSTGPAL